MYLFDQVLKATKEAFPGSEVKEERNGAASTKISVTCVTGKGKKKQTFSFFFTVASPACRAHPVEIQQLPHIKPQLLTQQSKNRGAQLVKCPDDRGFPEIFLRIPVESGFIHLLLNTRLGAGSLIAHSFIRSSLESKTIDPRQQAARALNEMYDGELRL